MYDDEEYERDSVNSFYNYIYYLAIKDSIPEEDIKQLFDYNYFTDIEFNPKKGTACQARAITLIKAMYDKYGEIPDFTPEEFFEFQNEVLEEL